MHNMQDSFVQCSTFGPDVICFRYWPVFLKKYKRQNIIKETLASVQLKKSCSKRLPSVHLDAVHTVIAQRLSEKNGCSFASSMHQNKGLFCVPFLKHVSSTEKCTNKQSTTSTSTIFGYVEKKDLEARLVSTKCRQPVSLHDHNVWLEAICVRTIHCEDLPCPDEGQMINIVDKDSDLLLSTFAKMDKSCFSVSPHSFADFTRASEQCYSDLTSNRCCTQFIGTSAFVGRRKTTSARVKPTVCSGPGQQLISQYYRSTFEDTFLPLINKCLNSLASSASRVCKKIYNDYDRMLLKTRPEERLLVDAHRYCSVTIFTSGKPGTSIGFCNGLHRDTNDKLAESWAQECNAFVENERTQEKKRSKHEVEDQCIKYVRSKNGPGLPTTCGYKIIITDSDNICESNVYAYFVNNDMSLCMKMQDNMVHCFLGYEFYHQTALPLVVLNNEVYYSCEGVRVMAWGDN